VSADDCVARGLRLCHLALDDDDDDDEDRGSGGGYGFAVHTGDGGGGAAAPGSTGQFVGDVERRSPAERAGLRPGDRVVEVNGVNVETDSHRQVGPSTFKLCIG